MKNVVSKCNSYNEEGNDYFDNKPIVIKNNVEIVENGVYNCGGEPM